jgi:hypothetical protein
MQQSRLNAGQGSGIAADTVATDRHTKAFVFIEMSIRVD